MWKLEREPFYGNVVIAPCFAGRALSASARREVTDGIGGPSGSFAQLARARLELGLRFDFEGGSENLIWVRAEIYEVPAQTDFFDLGAAGAISVSSTTRIGF